VDRLDIVIVRKGRRVFPQKRYRLASHTLGRASKIIERERERERERKRDDSNRCDLSIARSVSVNLPTPARI